MAEAAETSGETQDNEVKTQKPMENAPERPVRRNPCSVLKVSLLLLRAIGAHKGLTLASLKKELGNAGYEMCRNSGRHWGDTPRPEVKGTLLRVSGSDAAGCFKVWKIPKPKTKLGRPRVGKGVRSPRRIPPGRRSPRKHHVRRRKAEKARDTWSGKARVNARVRRVRPRAKNQVPVGAEGGARTKVVDDRRGRTTKEDSKPKSGEEKRPSSKPREEKHDAKKPVKQTIQKPTPHKTDESSSVKGKTRTKASTKSEGSRNAVGNS
ncbi:testis-specific H1 histone [Eulemur rufifrons]|uniref:testis-specific H1 histone n=1 Tax=Eulemur rufifrons TaxID=859984 RepID=UPI0037421F76